jgi:predicted O-methyltransferase YrrM
MDSTPDAWAAADTFLADTLVGHDPALEAALEAQRAAGLPEIEVAPVGGKLLSVLARMSGARRVLEIGTLGGYSTIWLARAVGPEGRVVTIEAEAGNAAVARASIDAAGVGDRVEIRIGRGEQVQPTNQGPLYILFIEADKESNTI